MDFFFTLLRFLDDLFWGYINFIFIVCAGFFFTIKSKGFQIKTLANFKKHIKELMYENKHSTNQGLSPFRLYFASVGGMIGLGNVVSVSTAVMLGGPGSIFWMWVASLFGMLIKYSEIYLSLKYRTVDNQGRYQGGFMYYLNKAYNKKFITLIACIFLGIYGVEVSQFVILTDRIQNTFSLDRNLVIFLLLFSVLISVLGGIKRLSTICSIMMPPFMLIYIIIALYIIISHYQVLPESIFLIFKSAFTGTAPIGGFIGSSLLLSAHQGMSRAIYSGDIGIGFDSIVQSETKITSPKKQAKLSIYALFMDTFICTLSTMIVLVSGAWYKLNDLEPSDIIPTILSNYFPHSDYFMTIVFFFAGFTTIISFLTAGIKCAEFINNKYGKFIYFIYAIFAFIFFSHYDQNTVYLIMNVTSGFLVLINLTAIIILRNKIEF